MPATIFLLLVLPALCLLSLSADATRDPEPDASCGTSSAGVTLKRSQTQLGNAKRPQRSKGQASPALAVAAAPARRAPRPLQVRMLVTAYCPCKRCCGPNAHGQTASGRRVSANGGRFVAADRRYAFGTLLRVPGYASGRPVPVLDRGGAIKGDRLDVYFPSHRQALRWGKQWVTVAVVK